MPPSDASLSQSESAQLNEAERNELCHNIILTLRTYHVQGILLPWTQQQSHLLVAIGSTGDLAGEEIASAVFVVLHACDGQRACFHLLVPSCPPAQGPDL